MSLSDNALYVIARESPIDHVAECGFDLPEIREAAHAVVERANEDSTLSGAWLYGFLVGAVAARRKFG